MLDLLIIGSGPGGYRAATLAALRGLSVGIVEKGIWGGCCLNRGCVPKKTWYHTAKLLEQKDYSERGILGNLSVDFPMAWQHQSQVVKTVRDSYLNYMKRLGVKQFAGVASFVDAETIQVQGHDQERIQMQAKKFIIATGAKPFIPEPFVLHTDKIITSDELFSQLPPKGKDVAIIGSGVIATEMAYILHKLDLNIYWLTRSTPLHRLGLSDSAQDVLMQALQDADLIVEKRSIKAYEIQHDHVLLHLNDETILTVDWVLLATGRRPVTEDLNLAAAGVDLDAQGFVKIDDYCQTTQPHIFAIGDVARPVMTANQALADAAQVIHNLFNVTAKAGALVPEVIYSAVEIAKIGLNEQQAEDAGLEPAIGFAAFEHSPAALGQGQSLGFVRLVADLDAGTLLGGEVVGDEAGELIHLLSLAPSADKALSWLAQGVFNHPARAEEFINACETLASKWGLSEKIWHSES